MLVELKGRDKGNGEGNGLMADLVEGLVPWIRGDEREEGESEMILGMR